MTSAWVFLWMTSLVCQTFAKPLDSTNRIAAILNDNLPNSLQDKADAIETVLRLLSDIDLPSICHAVMLDTRTEMNSVDDIIALAAKDQHMPFFPSKYPDDALFPVDLQKEMVQVVQPVRDRPLPGIKYLSKPDQNNRDNAFQESGNMIETVSPALIEKIKSLKSNITLPAEERQMEDDVSESELKMFLTGDIELDKDQAVYATPVVVTERPVKYTVIMSDETPSHEVITQSMLDRSTDNSDTSLDHTTTGGLPEEGKEDSTVMKTETTTNVPGTTNDSVNLTTQDIQDISRTSSSSSSSSAASETIVSLSYDPPVTTVKPKKNATYNTNEEYTTDMDTKSNEVSTLSFAMSPQDEKTDVESLEDVTEEADNIIMRSQDLLSKRKNVISENLKRVIEQKHSLQNESDAFSIEEEIEANLPPTDEPKRELVLNLTTENETETTTSPIIVDDYDSVEINNEYITDDTTTVDDVITNDTTDSDVNKSTNNTEATTTISSDVIRSNNSYNVVTTDSDVIKTNNSTDVVTTDSDVIRSTRSIQETTSTRIPELESPEESISSNQETKRHEIPFSDTKLETEILSTGSGVTPVNFDPTSHATTASSDDTTKYNLLGHLLNIHRSNTLDTVTTDQNDAPSTMLQPVHPDDIVTLSTTTTSSHDVEVIQTSLSPIQQFLKLINETFELAERTNLTYPYYDAEAAPYDVSAVQYATKSLSDLILETEDFTAAKEFENIDINRNIANTDDALNIVDRDDTFNQFKTEDTFDRINTDGTLNKIPYYHIEKDNLHHVGDKRDSKTNDVLEDYKKGVEPAAEPIAEAVVEPDVSSNLISSIDQYNKMYAETKEVLDKAYNERRNEMYDKQFVTSSTEDPVLDRLFKPQPQKPYDISDFQKYQKPVDTPFMIAPNTPRPAHQVQNDIVKPKHQKPYDISDFQKYQKPFDTPFMVIPATPRPTHPVQNDIVKPKLQKPYDISDFQKYQKPVDTPFMVIPATPRPTHPVQNDIVKPKLQKPYDISDFQKYQKPVDTPFMVVPAHPVQNDIVKPKPQKPYDISDFQKYQKPYDTPFMVAPNMPRPVRKEMSKPEYRSSLMSYPEPSMWGIPQEGPYRGGIFGHQFYKPGYGLINAGKVRNSWFGINGISSDRYHRKARVNNLASLGIKQHTVLAQKTPVHSTYINSQGHACPGLFGYYADVTDCGAFFICSWGIPYRFYCPRGTLWNTNGSVCDWTVNVNCNRN